MGAGAGEGEGMGVAVGVGVEVGSGGRFSFRVCLRKLYRGNTQLEVHTHEVTYRTYVIAQNLGKKQGRNRRAVPANDKQGGSRAGT